MAWPKIKTYRRCVVCDKQFEPRGKQSVCSPRCRNPIDKPVYTRICPSCNKEFSTTIESKRLCARACRHEQELILQVNWDSIREFVLERDNYTCQECDKMKIDTSLHVHHIKPVYKGGQSVEKNLVTLCHDCHHKKHKIRSTSA